MPLTRRKTRKGVKGETRHKHGEYQNVLLTDADLEKLKDEFPTDWQQRIDRLSGYIQSKGVAYKDHLATIRNWARKDNQDKPKEPDYTKGWGEYA